MCVCVSVCVCVCSRECERERERERESVGSGHLCFLIYNSVQEKVRARERVKHGKEKSKYRE